MGTAPLVDQEIADGKALLRHLDRDPFPVSAAFWYYDTEAERWSLVMATPLVADRGPLEAYRLLGKSMRKLRGSKRRPFMLDSSRVRLVKEEDDVVTLLRRAIITGRDIAGIRFTGNVVGGRLIEDAYIYRLAQPLAA